MQESASSQQTVSAQGTQNDLLLAQLAAQVSALQAQLASSNVSHHNSTTTVEHHVWTTHSSVPSSASFVASVQSLQNNPTLAKLNASVAQVNSQEVSTALQTTIPSVVSNIFTSLEQSMQNAQLQPPSANATTTTLVSMDGSTSGALSANATLEDVSAEGERLFLSWLEHQMTALHLTASMANSIRKNSLLMFRRIVDQYIERAKLVGGSLQDNVRRANQLALSNTQDLISYLLSNYVNFAGGFMRIIGEQVSRVGKQIDSTGSSMKHASVNPFDIISSVIDALPNPSTYSQYFRDIGKQLVTAATDQPKTTMLGSLSKMIPSWIG